MTHLQIANHSLDLPSTDAPIVAEPQADPKPAPPKLLAIDIGGSKVKALATGQTEPRRIPSGRRLTPSKMVQGIREITKDWEYTAVSIGIPGLVGANGPKSEPLNLGAGWVGFDFAAAFERPVRFMNDAAMQALGSYEGGRMLFLGLGTGLGSAFIADNVVVCLELGRLLTSTGETLGDVLGRKGLRRIGKRKWRAALTKAVETLASAFVVDHIVLGGGNAKELKVLPANARLGHNMTAFRGGFRLWNLAEVQTHHPDGAHEIPLTVVPTDWRVL